MPVQGDPRRVDPRSGGMLVWEVTLHPCAPMLVGMDPVEAVRALYLRRELREFRTHLRSADSAYTQVPAIFASRYQRF